MLIQVETDPLSPRLTQRHVRRVLKWINPEDLKDLHAIRVIDERPNDPEYTKRPHYLSGFLYNGHYEFKTKDRQARVVLYASDVHFGIPKLFASTSIATLKLARTLAHEIGHHVIATRGYLYKPWEKYRPWTGVNDPHEEAMVSAYADDVINKMLGQWRYKFGAFLTRKLSNLFYDAGLQQYSDGNFQRAAQLGFRAYHLDPTNTDASQCHRHAMEKLKTQTPSPLNDDQREWLLHGYDGAPSATARMRNLSKAIDKGRRKKRGMKGRTR